MKFPEAQFQHYVDWEKTSQFAGRGRVLYFFEVELGDCKIGWLFPYNLIMHTGCIIAIKSLVTNKVADPLKKSESGLIWCHCGNLLGNTSVGFLRKGDKIIRMYYFCIVCKREFDLGKTDKGWEYQHFKEIEKEC